MLFRIEYRKKPKAFNGIPKGSHWALSAELREWREAFAWECKAQRLRPVEGPVDILVHHMCRTKQLSDCGAVFIPAKGAVDGLVDARVLPHDGPEVVRQLIFVAPFAAGYDALALEVMQAE